MSVRTLPGGALVVWPETLSQTPWLINKSAGGPPFYYSNLEFPSLRNKTSQKGRVRPARRAESDQPEGPSQTSQKGQPEGPSQTSQKGRDRPARRAETDQPEGPSQTSQKGRDRPARRVVRPAYPQSDQPEGWSGGPLFSSST